MKRRSFQFKVIILGTKQNIQNTIAEISKFTYSTYLKLNEDCMKELETDPYSISIDKMMVFILI